MQGKTEPSIKLYTVSTDCGNNAPRLVNRCHQHDDSCDFLGRTIKRHKFSNAVKKPFRFTRRRSTIKLPTRFLLGGTIHDPLNLQGLEKECTRESENRCCERHKRTVRLKHSHRIGFPDITDASDPLNLKNVSSKEPESFSDDCLPSMETKKNACGQNHCQEALETDHVLDMMPSDENEDALKQECQSVGTSADLTEKLCPHNNSFALNDRNQHCVQVPESSTNHCKTDSIPVEAACKIASGTSSEHMPSVFSEDEAVACTYRNKITSHEKIVSPAVSQYSPRRARKRKRQGACAGKETFPSASRSHNSLCKKSKEKFPCGNYVAYYGYRNVDMVEDLRLQLLSKELFEGKDVLDVGCNAGVVTIAVACTYLPRQILGIDVDQRLISLAKRNVRRYLDENLYPSCLKTTFGPIAASLLPSAECSAFPHNVLFQVGDYVPSSNADLSRQREEYDVILALSVTKWIHLMHGDAGLKRAFVRMFRQLRPGGKLVLEAQPWASYKRKKKLTEKIFEVYQSIRFKPEQFNDYLLSTEVGFMSCTLLGTPAHKSKGFQRSIYLFTKPNATADTSST